MLNIIITGASHGIGQATAEAFATLENCHIALISRKQEKLEQVQKNCIALGAQASVYACDLTDEASVNSTTQEILKDMGAPDVLINNAGGFEPGDLISTDKALFQRQLDVNVNSAFMMTHNFAESMMNKKSGNIFFISSVAALGPYPRGLAYSVAKHAVVGLAHGVREELKEHGIRVSCVYPGATLTPTWGDISDLGLTADRLMKAEDVAQAILSAYRLSPHTVVEDIILRPQLGDI